MSFQNSMLYNEILRQQGLLDQIYTALNPMDGSVVIEAYKVMCITNGFPFVQKVVKNYDRSSAFRSRGNTRYQKENYRAALEMYNNALLFAPKDSIEMLHAYGNRSALFYHLNAYTACINDIEQCRKLGCSGELDKKLNNRYDQCREMLWKENLKNGILLSNFGKEFFKFNGKKHSDIPCLSAEVDIISACGENKAIAAKDIKVGTLLAVEPAFVTHPHKGKSLLSCYYCKNMTLNLTPCDNCCFALFCSEKCKEICLNEYHNIECQIMEILQYLEDNGGGFKFRLAMQAVLKLKSRCRNWKTLIEEAQNMGASRLENSALSEAYNVENYSSILCFKEDRTFVYGAMYNYCFIYASVFQHLERIKGFFPASKSECEAAKKCFWKLCLNLQLYWWAVELQPSAEALSLDQVVSNLPSHYGWFPFTGRLKHSCEANLIALGLDNRVALVAVRPIKKMTELTISYIGHWYENLYGDKRRFNLYQTLRDVCRCRVCAGAWGITNFQRIELDHDQKKAYHSWQHVMRSMMFPQKDPSFYRETCKGLTVLDELPNTKEHYEMFREFRTQLSLCQFAATDNKTIVTTVESS